MSEVTGAGLAEVERELRRVSDRLGHLALSRLTGPTTDPATAAQIGPAAGLVQAPATRADAAWVVVQRLADLCAGLEAGSEPSPPPGRAVPRLDPRALADQLLVTGNDLLLVAGSAAAGPDDQSAWLDGRRVPVAEVVAAAYAALVALRRAL